MENNILLDAIFDLGIDGISVGLDIGEGNLIVFFDGFGGGYIH